MKASQGIEIEKKYDVGNDATVPALEKLPGVARVGTPQTAELEAVYFDTDRHTLASRRLTLRRRTGGIDAGWHLKLPPEATGGSEKEPRQRRELHAPLGQPDVVPDILLAHVQAHLRGTAVAPVVRLETRRTTHALYGEDGVHLADLADDEVQATRLRGPADEQPQRWREWELELVDGGPELFGPAGELLAAAGARPAGHASKLARALGSIPGGTGEQDGESPAALLAGKKAPAAAVVTVYVAEQLRLLLAEDAAVRLEEPEGVHDMRSAIRRIRSVLGGYRKLYRAIPVRRLRDELRWLGLLLGEPRDAEVLRGHLREHLDALPPGEGSDAAREHVERKAGAAFDAGYRRLQEVLQSERYFRLLDDLESFCSQPPVLSQAVAPGRTVAAKVVGKSARRLRRSHKAAAHARRGTAHENALHQVRKDAKRLRHVAESAVLVRGKRARKVAKAAHRQQKILGDYHDAVIARNLLQTLESGHGLPEATAEALAVLRAQQAELMDGAEAKYRKARKKSRHLLRGGVL
ncbi:CHAD domain-containing protein [Pseudarthrobacter sp. NPDC058329]|uniref:CYTH and CHAD domain-containing protein n=1 Tax=Pseudarthrobacter sp. NPDC058329 TaxID=3346448 RepID=UPI0036DCFB54